MGLAVAGAEPGSVLAASAAATTVTTATATGGRFVADDARSRIELRLPPLWLGTPAARDEAMAAIAADLSDLARAVNAQRAVLLPPGVRPAPGAPAVTGGDVHRLEAADEAELEVLCNLLRRHTAVLIALAGRAVSGPGAAGDRVGSRWLADSREHLAARYVGSAAPGHLDRVRAQLRREGIADLERMDVAPVPAPDAAGGYALVRCLDAQTSLGDLRALMLLLAALGLRARRMVRGGRREAGTPQRVVERNRTRAVAEGLRARFETTAEQPKRGKGTRRDARAAAPADQFGGSGGSSVSGGEAARSAARRLLIELVPEFVNLGASALELAPLVLAVELPPLGVRPARTTELLDEIAVGDPSGFPARVQALLCDPTPGGPLLARLRGPESGRVTLALESWRARLDDRTAGSGER